MVLHGDFFEHLTLEGEGHQRGIRPGVFEEFVVVPLAMTGPPPRRSNATPGTMMRSISATSTFFAATSRNSAFGSRILYIPTASSSRFSR